MYPALLISRAVFQEILKQRKTITEPELQTYLYRIQKESIRQIGKPMICEQFFADLNGAFIPSIRQQFSGQYLCHAPGGIEPTAQEIIKSVLASPTPSSCAKGPAWQKARIPLTPNAEATRPIENQWIVDEVARDCVRDERIVCKP